MPSFWKHAPVALEQHEKRARVDSEFKRNARLVRERDGRHCRICGALAPLETDHLIPRSLVGKALRNQTANLVTLCGGDGGCHPLKTKHVIRITALDKARGADGPLMVEKYSKPHGGYVVVLKEQA